MAKTKAAKPAGARKSRSKVPERSVPSMVVPGYGQLLAQCGRIFARYWKPLGGLLVIYVLLNIFFASGISSIHANLESIKADLNNTGPNAHPYLSAAAGFFVLVSSSGSSSNSAGGVLQSMLIVLESLAIIWSLRHLLAGKKVYVKEAYYNSMAPLVPFLLVIGVLFLELLPITLGSAILVAIASALGTITGIWSFIFILLLAGLVAWSFYMLSSSIFGLYIVTLPQMRPMSALASAKNLVRSRRFAVLRRVLFLPVFMFAVAALVIIPLVAYATFLAAPVFYIFSALALLFAHSYLYTLYRGLLG